MPFQLNAVFAKLATHLNMLFALCSPAQNAPPEVQQTFADNRLYCGGFTAQHVGLSSLPHIVCSLTMSQHLRPKHTANFPSLASSPLRFLPPQVIHLLHGHPLPGAQAVIPGVFMGGEQAAAAEVSAGRLAADEFRFFAGAMVWDVGELDREAELGCW